MKKIKIAILDLYNNEKNEGMRCIREIVGEVISSNSQLEISSDVFDIRYKNEIAGSDYDIFISSGGPGSPFEGVGTVWEKNYFNLIDKIWDHNQSSAELKKHAFFICHSFQMMARHFRFAEVNKRYEKSFGIISFLRTETGKYDLLLKNLNDPFYAADFRDFQVVEPDTAVIRELDAKVLAVENPSEINGHLPALMAVRITNEIAGTQFHPEADAESMLYHFRQEARKLHVVEKYGEEKYYEMIRLLKDPDAIVRTRQNVLPVFLQNAVDSLSTVLSDK
ncbi:MAG: hypothetical protein Kow0098_27000 [Ignavibacteriaceae bacterium]